MGGGHTQPGFDMTVSFSGKLFLRTSAPSYRVSGRLKRPGGRLVRSATISLPKFKIRTQPDRWPAGKFIHPHDACFDKEGNIFVTEWVQTGRVSLLRRVS